MKQFTRLMDGLQAAAQAVTLGVIATSGVAQQADPALIVVSSRLSLDIFRTSATSNTTGNPPFSGSLPIARDFIDVDRDGFFRLNSQANRQQDLLVQSVLASQALALQPDSSEANVRSVWFPHGRFGVFCDPLRELRDAGLSPSTLSIDQPNQALTRVGLTLVNLSRPHSMLSANAQFVVQPVWFDASRASGLGWGTFVDFSTMPNSTIRLVPGGARTSEQDPGQGVRLDIACLDAAVEWLVSGEPGETSVWRLPTEAGFGRNSARARLFDGTLVESGEPWRRGLLNDSNSPVTYSYTNHVLASLNLNTSSANSNTLFQSPIAFNPVVAIVNPGTNLESVSASDLRHSLATGRLRTGLNLVQMTVGPRSALTASFAISLGIDPSFARGEGVQFVPASPELGIVSYQPGPSSSPSHAFDLEGELFVRNHRLAIGYASVIGVTASPSPLRAIVNGDQVLGSVRLPRFIDDVSASQLSSSVFPFFADVTQSPSQSKFWKLGGLSSFVTIGDPLAQPIADGGLGTPNPRVRNKAAADYINNFRASNFEFTLTPFSTIGPAVECSRRLPTMLPVLRFVPTSQGAGEFAPNPFSSGPQAYSSNAIAHPSIAATQATWDFSIDAASIVDSGVFPIRSSSSTLVYSDGVTGAGSYRGQDGNPITYSTAMMQTTAGVRDRNAVAGDFDANGQRDLNDVPGMIAAWRDRNGGPVWDGVGVNGGDEDLRACIEILGDFDGDGSFTSADIRYFADGLSLVAGTLDRSAGFVGVDDAFGGNFFGTIKATNVAYVNGDSRADVAGARAATNNLGAAVPAYFRVTPGHRPIGSDGIINGNDICYVSSQFRADANREIDWTDLTEAVNADLSADMNGDLLINQADVDVIFAILGTTNRDINLDGVVNGADLAVVDTNLGLVNACFQDGDANGDGVVDSTDRTIVLKCGPADLGGEGASEGPDGILDNNDFIVHVQLFFDNDPRADLGGAGGVLQGDGVFDNNDFVAFISAFFAGC